MIAFGTVDVYLELADEDVACQTAKTRDWSIVLSDFAAHVISGEEQCV